MLSYVSGYLGSDVTPIAVLVLLLAVLLVRPGGLFSATGRGRYEHDRPARPARCSRHRRCWRSPPAWLLLALT